MKSIKFLTVALLSALSIVANGQITELNDEEMNLFRKAGAYYDNNAPDMAIPIFEKLLQKHPKNYIVNYEYCLPLMQKGRYYEVIKICKKLENNPHEEAQLYQLEGNAYDYVGKRKSALATYDKGLLKYPKSGSLFMEKGNIYYSEEQWGAALSLYEKAMEVEPTYPSPYFRASSLYLDTSEPVAGIIYGEAFLLMEKGERNSYIQKKLKTRIEDHIKFVPDTAKGDSSLMLTLTKRSVTINGLNLKIPFEIKYEIAITHSPAVIKMLEEKRKNITASDFIEMRKAVVKEYNESWKQKQPNYLFEYQSQLIDGGYFDAYTMDIFQEAFSDEYKAYISNAENKAKIDALHIWMKQHPFQPNTDQPIVIH